MTPSRLTRSTLIAAGSVLALTLAACGEEELPETTAELPTATEDLPDPGEVTEGAEAAVGEVFGTSCSAVPDEGPGSLATMAEESVATAAGNNPLLSTLSDALAAANLGDTLNTQESVTVLAPVNAAFEDVPPDALQALLAEPAQLTDILTFHVIDGQLTPADLAGEQTTLNGASLTIEGSGEDFSIPAEFTLDGANPATVVCGNIATANGTVYLIDEVLAPPAG